MIERSVLYLGCAGGFFVAAAVVFAQIHKKKKNIAALVLYFCSVLFINYASLSAGQGSMSGWNRFFAGIINTLQSFSLDANYEEIVSNLQGGVADNTLILVPVFIVLVFAPILGGAVLLAVIADVFPDVKFWIQSRFSRTLYLFSFLNEQSLNMAKELLKEGKREKVCVVFANAWVEEGNEDESNLVSLAEEIGAICLKKDLSVLRLPAKKEADYFFARDDDLRNLDEAIRIAGEAKEVWKGCRQVSLYVFAQNDTAYRAMEQIHAQMEQSDRERMRVIVVPYQTNTVYRLLYEEPLYECLSPDPNAEEALKVVIVGSDAWAEELYRAIYWCGQMPHKQLSIISLSEDAEQFERRIRFLIPELDSVDNERPYCISRFLSCRADTSDLDELLRSEHLSEAGIWYVCMGDGQKNLEIASHLKSRLSALQIQRPRKTVIHFQLENDHLKQALNQANREGDLYQMHAFASALEQYSSRSFHSELHTYAGALHSAWENRLGVRNSVNEYNRRSSYASAVHLPYRLYAFGLLPQRASSTSEAVRLGLENYRSQPDFQRRHEYAIGWMEHRRWNAYMRALGYRKVSIADWRAYYDTEEGQKRRQAEQRIDTKDHLRKLHTCLTEYLPQSAVPEGFLEHLGAGWQESPLVTRLMEEGRLDELDALSVAIYRMGEGLKSRGDDIKHYDADPIEKAAAVKLHAERDTR